MAEHKDWSKTIEENRQTQRSASAQYLESQTAVVNPFGVLNADAGMDPKDRWWFVVLKDPQRGPEMVTYSKQCEDPRRAKNPVGVRLYRDDQIVCSALLSREYEGLSLAALIKYWEDGVRPKMPPAPPKPKKRADQLAPLEEMTRPVERPKSLPAQIWCPECEQHVRLPVQECTRGLCPNMPLRGLRP